ncbi:MAG: polynucleotide adenylyltransferase PcnB [Polyangiaceae bacterium]|nr:polynucleotide adenylyltransferase PcnB [Polyangiaceae bacterium]
MDPPPDNPAEAAASAASGPAPRTERRPADGETQTPTPSGCRRYEVIIDPAYVDPDVRKVIRRLTQNGHEAYLVGGCVRDLLLGRQPKDFDVATSAHPEDVRTLFRNSRIIGRRFRLVHVLFHGGKVIEVATFRKNPNEEDTPAEAALIRSDNVFGEADEDARRRDFTINGLFYDIERSHIIDWVGGMRDIQRRVMRTVGDPETRFIEDPVRILRAIKFAGRLDLGIARPVYDAIVYCRESLKLAARPRVAEEILRLMRGGEARRSVYIAWETGVLDVLIPELAALLYDADGDDTAGARVWRQLAYIDRRHRAGDSLDDTVLWTLLLLEAMKETCEGERDRSTAVANFLDSLIERLAITRRSADGMRRIVGALPRIVGGKPGRLARSESFPMILDVAEADCLAQGLPARHIQKLRSGYRPSAADEP